MSALMHPVGPRPARVYWRRRIVLLALLATVAIVLANVVGGRGSAQAAQDPAGTSGAAADQTPDPTTTEGTDTTAGPVPCGEGSLSITLTADHRTYAAGANPVFTVLLTNTSDTSCVVDAGEASRGILITSGSDRIWSSLDCPAKQNAERTLLLPAGGRDESAVTWTRIRSAEGCTDGLPAPRPGTYTAVASVAGVSSTAAVFELK
jgi:hypothetical protein